MNKKIKIMETIELCDSGFYFQFCFNTAEPRSACSYVDPLDLPNVVGATKERMLPYKSIGLTYDFNFSNKDEFEICYADWGNQGIMQIRTYL
jgi:hypothetical protein